MRKTHSFSTKATMNIITKYKKIYFFFLLFHPTMSQLFAFNIPFKRVVSTIKSHKTPPNPCRQENVYTIIPNRLQLKHISYPALDGPLGFYPELSSLKLKTPLLKNLGGDDVTILSIGTLIVEIFIIHEELPARERCKIVVTDYLLNTICINTLQAKLEQMFKKHLIDRYCSNLSNTTKDIVQDVTHTVFSCARLFVCSKIRDKITGNIYPNHVNARINAQLDALRQQRAGGVSENMQLWLLVARQQQLNDAVARLELLRHRFAELAEQEMLKHIDKAQLQRIHPNYNGAAA